MFVTASVDTVLDVLCEHFGIAIGYRFQKLAGDFIDIVHATATGRAARSLAVIEADTQAAILPADNDVVSSLAATMIVDDRD